jgi:sarcosine oxidase subunit beta
MAQFRRMVPAMRALHVIRVWSGVESYLPDSEPVIGPSSTTDGLFYAFGFSGSGFQIGPGVGETLAEVLDSGSTPIDLTSFSIRRFQRASSTHAESITSETSP